MRWDQHVHSNYSWDAPRGHTVSALCAAAAELGLDGIAVTDHFDSYPGRGIWNRRPTGVFGMSSFLADIAMAREAFPALTVHAGIEYGEPHLDHVQALKLRRDHHLDLVLGSVHSLVVNDELVPIEHVVASDPLDRTMRTYLEQVVTMVERSPIDVVAHLEYPLRSVDPGRYDPDQHSHYYTRIIAVATARGIALEYNTKSAETLMSQLWPVLDGYPDLTFTVGSDAHTTDRIGERIDEAAEVLGAHGYRGCRSRPGRRCRHRDCR